MTTTDKDFGEFATLGLQLRLLTPAHVHSWADSIIAAHDEPPAWAIDLSMAQLSEITGLLNSVPGEISGDLPVRMLLGLVHRKWKNGSISLQQVRRIGFRLHLDRRLPQPEVGADWGVVLECLCEEFDGGFRTEAEMRGLVHEYLAPYAAYERYVLDWA